jgi:hypothetical protein
MIGYMRMRDIQVGSRACSLNYQNGFSPPYAVYAYRSRVKIVNQIRRNAAQTHGTSRAMPSRHAQQSMYSSLVEPQGEEYRCLLLAQLSTRFPVQAPMRRRGHRKSSESARPVVSTSRYVHCASEAHQAHKKIAKQATSADNVP